MKLIKQILIKQVITENSKKKLESKFKDEKKDLALKCEQLIFEKKKLQKEKKSATHKIEQRFQVEIDNRKRKINQIDFQLEQLHQLPLGSEIVENKKNKKKKIESKIKDKKKDLALKCEQLIFEKKKLQKEKKSATHKIEQRFQVEIDNRKRKINQIDFQLEQLHQLPLGSEIVETKMESLVEVKLGMNWSNFQNETAIIIEDDIVIRIDNE